MLKYTEEQLKIAVKESKTLKDVVIKLGYKYNRSGSNVSVRVREHIKRLNLNQTHWDPFHWKRGQRLKDWGDYLKSDKVKIHLIKDRNCKCDSCGRKTWLGKIIPFEIHHINGDHNNNNYINLQLLCPNCHAMTNNYCGKNKKHLRN